MKKLMMFAVAFTAIAASAAVTITDVTARQRWPWNSLVDVDFTIGGAAGEAYYVDVSAKYDNGNRSLVAKTFVTEPIAATGRNRVVWNLGADYPEFKADDISVTVTVTPFSDSTPLYLVVDLSGGASATSYAVRYTTTAPVHTAGQNDPCKTSELWLKRVKAGTIEMGGGEGGYAVHTCTLTNDFYLGIFPITWGQYVNIGQTAATSFEPQLFAREEYRTTRPLDCVRIPVLFDENYPEFRQDTILKRLRDRTGLMFSLPTEWQWEYAARAGNTGTATGLSGQYRAASKPPTDWEYYSDKGMWTADYGTFYVDAYNPNDWGFYSMIGNVRQWCINRLASISAGDSLIEPQGGALTGVRYSVMKGREWDMDTRRSYGWHSETDSWSISKTSYDYGARVCLTIKKNAE